MKRRNFLFLAGGAVVAAAAFVTLTRGSVLSGSEAVGATCSYCGMRVERKEFAAELIVDGKRLIYDDIGCMLIHYLSFTGKTEPVKSTWSNAKIEKIYVYSYDSVERFEASTAWFVKGSDVKTPMRHGYLAFKSMSRAVEFAKKHGGEVYGWDAAVESFLKPQTDQQLHTHVHGKDAFDIELKLLDNKPVTVNKLLTEGKPVLLVFFATWCPTCSKNISTLTKAYPSFRGKVTVLLTSFDPGDTVQEIQRFLEIHNASNDWVVAQPNLEFLVSLHVITQETIFGISPKGEIVYEKRFGTLTEDDWLKIADHLIQHH